MKICILGSGPSGASLYRMLKFRGIDPDIFSKKEDNPCGMRACSWGVDKDMFDIVCRKLELNSDSYCINILNSFKLNWFKLPCNLAIINKRKLIEDLVGGKVKYDKPNLENYDRIIDATGSSNGRYHTTHQIRIRESLPLSVRVKPNLEVQWFFPIRGETHIGILNPKGTKVTNGNIICECSSKLNRGGLVHNLIEDRTWKVGETAGVVDPITGSGILSSIASSMILDNNLHKPEEYVNEMEKRFSYTRSFFRTLFHNEFRGLKIKLGAIG